MPKSFRHAVFTVAQRGVKVHCLSSKLVSRISRS